jgi:CHRD domain
MSVIRRLTAVLFLVAVLAALAVATPAAATQDSATKCAAYAVLKPGNEVPPTASRTLGAAAIHINGTTLSFAVTIANPQRETFFAGHIHIGAAGVNGPVRVALFSGSNDRKLFFQAARITISETDAVAICGDLAGHYVNYHTTTFPGGALRGQLVGV